MKKSIVILSVFLASCGYHVSDVKKEKGVVIEKQWHAPVERDGIGYNMSNVNLQYHTLNDEEKFLVVFKCQHGVVFSINRSELFAMLEKGDSVNIYYTELLNGKNEIVDFDFLLAKKKP